MIEHKRNEVFCILKDNGTVKEIVKHPIYTNKPFVIDGENIARMYLESYRKLTFNDKVTYTLVPYNESSNGE